MKFYFIVTGYNCGKYVKECLESIQKQYNMHFHCIVVNDGSTDKSGTIVQAMVDDRIHVITQKNQGASKARNVGIKAAKGT